MKALVVHDRESARNDIVGLLESCGVSRRNIETADDGTTARGFLSTGLFDLLIIDLTIPHITNVDRPNFEVADLLLNEIFLLDNLNPPGDIIGITNNEDALSLIRLNVNSHVMDIIAEKADSSWKPLLLSKIHYCLKTSRSRQIVTNSQFDYDLLIVTALDKELAPYREAYEFEQSDVYPGCSTFVFPDRSGVLRRAVAFSVGKSGEARAANATQTLLALFRPQLTIMSGICGGVGKVKLGDIVIAESAIDWDYGKWEDLAVGAVAGGGEDQTSAVFSARPDPVSIFDSPVHRACRDLENSSFVTQSQFTKAVSEKSHGLITEPQLHLAPMASGSAVIGSAEVVSQIKALNGAIRGIDMECFGFYLAGSKTHVVKPQMVCVKSIADFSNGSKGDRYHAGCSFASYLVSKEIYEGRFSYVP